MKRLERIVAVVVVLAIAGLAGADLWLNRENAVVRQVAEVVQIIPAIVIYHADNFLNRDRENAIASAQKGDYATALRVLHPLAEKGDAKAQYHIAHMYYVGRGLAQNQVEGLRWYRISAEQGYAPSQWVLGLHYEMGMGVERNYAKAYMWYSLAAEHGSGFIFNWSTDERQELVGKMSKVQLVAGQRLLSEWRPDY